jgi:hypothetical protein
LLKVGDKFHLYYKTRSEGGTLYALAVADQLTGPYRMLDQPPPGHSPKRRNGLHFSNRHRKHL